MIWSQDCGDLRTVKGTGWTRSGRAALLYMCSKWHVIPSKGPASVVNQCPWTAQPQTDKEQALVYGLTVSSHCHAHCERHPRQAAMLHTGNQSSAAVRSLWLCAWCDYAAVWFTHNLGVLAGVFEVACVQRPSRSAVRSSMLLGWALACLPV